MGRSLTEEQRAARDAYHNSPEYKAKVKAYDKARYEANKQKPEYIARINSPEYKAYHQAYTSTPEYKAKMRAYYQSAEHKAKTKIRNRSERAQEMQARWRSSPECKEYLREYNNRPERRALAREYSMREDQRAKRKAYSQTQKFKEKQKAYQSTDEYKEKRKARYYDKMNNDMTFKLKTLIRTRVRRYIKGTGRFGHSAELLGCSLEEARAYIESQFQEGMTWDNWAHDGWHLDHRKPVASFDLTKDEDVRACFHYSNLQPLWCHDNISKSSTWDGTFHKQGKPIRKTP